jgi:hypothetical protein
MSSPRPQLTAIPIVGKHPLRPLPAPNEEGKDHLCKDESHPWIGEQVAYGELTMHTRREKITGHSDSRSPSPMGVQELRDWAGNWGKYLLSVETGEIRPELATNL